MHLVILLSSCDRIYDSINNGLPDLPLPGNTWSCALGKSARKMFHSKTDKDISIMELVYNKIIEEVDSLEGVNLEENHTKVVSIDQKKIFESQQRHFDN